MIFSLKLQSRRQSQLYIRYIEMSVPELMQMMFVVNLGQCTELLRNNGRLQRYAISEMATFLNQAW